MKEVIQTIGTIIALIFAIIGYVLAFSRARGDEKWLFAYLLESSGIAIIVLIIFLSVSLLF